MSADDETAGGRAEIRGGGPARTAGAGASGTVLSVVSGIPGSGVSIDGLTSVGNVVAGNFIGTDVTGTLALGNDGAGVLCFGAPGNTIGGTTEAARNVISANDNAGV